jgi:hypothetical protein
MWSSIDAELGCICTTVIRLPSSSM